MTRSTRDRRRTTCFTAVLLGTLAAAGPAGADSRSDEQLQLVSLASRPDLVSGGDALVEVRVPARIPLDAVSVTLNGRDVTGDLARNAGAHTLRGLVAGLEDGENALVASAAGKGFGRRHAELTLTNHPITGPILSGPHLTPYECRTVESGLGEPLDADCSADTRYDYFYRTTAKKFARLDDPVGPRPADLATTTTNDGRTVPYIVRVESGTINRTIYRIAVLDDPREPGVWNPASWNRKLVFSFGGGCGTNYNQGVNQATDALNDLALSRGFAYAISTEDVNQLHCNDALQGEALMMVKEHFIERYDVPKWTVGTGGSGGAIQQLLIAQNFPGLLDGIQPSASFPDSQMHVNDCRLLLRIYASDPARWTQAKQAAIDGYTNGTCAQWDVSFVDVIVATKGCGLNDASKVYDPVTNPGGARCTVQDMQVNSVGRDPATGFARSALDNVGVQYGLAALNGGAITASDFLDLNERIGGFDIDGNVVDVRTVGNLDAIRLVYETGRSNSGAGGLATTPILESRSYIDQFGNIHDRFRDLVIRARLERANGRSDNQVIWTVPFGGVNLGPASLDVMNDWLDNMAADSAPLDADKVARNRPPEAVDTCWDLTGKAYVEPATYDGPGTCNALYPNHADPSLVAGMPLTDDVLKCQLKPVDFADYAVAFTDAEKARLASIFPDGVCDWSQPGVNQKKLRGVYQRLPIRQRGGGDGDAD